MRILFFGDVHHKIANFELGKQFVDWIVHVVDTKQPDMVVNLGDYFDNHAILRSEVLSVYRNLVDNITTQQNIPYFHILGNHEFFRPTDVTYHALQAMRGVSKNLFIVDKVVDVQNMTFVPYQSDISKFPSRTQNICIAHQTFLGADYGYMRPEVGVDPSHVSAELIVSGHLHTRQEFNKVVYPGSSYAQGVVDVGQSKFIMMLDSVNYSREFIVTPFPQWKIIKGEIFSQESLDNFHEMITQFVCKPDHWVIELKGRRAELTSYLTSSRYRDAVKDIDVKLRTEFTDSEKRSVTINSTSMEQTIRDYVSKVYTGTIDKSQIIDAALQTVTKARSLGIK